MKTWRIAGINFNHMHMGDQLRLVHEHPNAEIVGICHEDPAVMQASIRNFSIPDDRVFTDYNECMETTTPDFVVLCPSTETHAEWTVKLAEYSPHIMIEKPFLDGQDNLYTMALVEAAYKSVKMKRAVPISEITG